MSEKTAAGDLQAQDKRQKRGWEEVWEEVWEGKSGSQVHLDFLPFVPLPTSAQMTAHTRRMCLSPWGTLDECAGAIFSVKGTVFPTPSHEGHQKIRLVVLTFFCPLAGLSLCIEPLWSLLTAHLSVYKVGEITGLTRH